MNFVGSSSDEPAHILKALKEHPNMVYVPRDQQAMYALYGEDIMFCFVGDFSSMNEEDVNSYIQNSLKKVQDAARIE